MLVNGQTSEDKTRTIKGYVIDKTTRTIPIGINILQYKTANGAVVGPDGTFEMKVNKQDTVLVCIPFCFSTYYVLFLPKEHFKKIVLSKRLEKKSKQILDEWKRNKKR